MTRRDIRIGVDVGGTFTDVVLFADNTLETAKVPTTDDQSVGVLAGIEKVCDRASIDPDEIETFAHATTVSVNALLERTGAQTALVTTAGFRDVLEIGRQDRPALYDLAAEKPDPLVPRRRRFTVDERTTPAGVKREVDPDAVRELAADIEKTDAESVAVCLLHSYAHPANERTVASVLREELNVPVSASAEVLAEFREYERMSTTTVDAYVTPTISSYVSRLVDRTTDTGIPAPRIMQSNGGIADVPTVRDHAVTTVLSGPAAGVVGAAETTNTDGLVTFDMGGTSSDVSLIQDGTAARTTDAAVDGLPIRTPMVDVNTVGAGGGSIAWVDDGGALRVGPHSAGAVPGPVCYGRGGTDPTVTDATVVLGYIGPDAALGGEVTLDVDAAYDALADLAREAGLDGPRAVARGVFRVANATMTRAIRAVTVERGTDPRGLSLVAFGGAGPVHAAALADTLGMNRVVVPRPAGVLSAYGLLAADETHDAVRTVNTELATADGEFIDNVYASLADTVRSDVSDPERATVTLAADCRYAGQSFELTVPVTTFATDTVASRFHAAHESAYGYTLEEAIEVVNLRATATVERPSPTVEHHGTGNAQTGTRAVQFPGYGAHETTVYTRNALAVNETVAGPAILEQAEATTVVPPDWTGQVDTAGTLILEAAT